jgi:hypothetical protein
MITALTQFVITFHEFTNGAPTETGFLLTAFGESGQTKLELPPPDAQLLHEALQGNNNTMQVAGLTPEFLGNIQSIGFDPDRVEAATRAMDSMIIKRNAVEWGRLLAHAERSKAERDESFN